MQRLGFDVSHSGERVVARCSLVWPTSYLEQNCSAAAKNRRRPNQPPVFLIVVNAQTERSIRVQCLTLQRSFGAYSHTGPLIPGSHWRVLLHERQRGIPVRWAESTDLFAFLTDHLSLPPADAIYRHVDSAVCVEL